MTRGCRWAAETGAWPAEGCAGAVGVGVSSTDGGGLVLVGAAAAPCTRAYPPSLYHAIALSLLALTH